MTQNAPNSPQNPSPAREKRIPTTQAQRVIARFGGARKLAAALNVVEPTMFRHAETVYKWTYPKEKGGTGGVIPTASLALVLKAARAEGIFLTDADLWPGVR